LAPLSILSTYSAARRHMAAQLHVLLQPIQVAAGEGRTYPRVTNMSTRTLDVLRFGFGPA
jgi:hypothetical protein